MAVVLCDDFGVALLVDEGDVDERDHDADDDGDEGQRGDALWPAAHLLEDDGVGREQEEERAVHDGEEEREQRDDGLVDEHDPGPQGADAQLLCDGFWCHAGDLVGLPSLLCEFCCAALQKHGGVRLGECECQDNPRWAGCSRDQDGDCTPPVRLDEEAADNRSEVLAYEAREREDGHYEAAVLRVEHVGDNGGGDGLGEGAGEAAKETQDDDHGHG